VWRSGSALQAYKRGCVCLKSSGALEARCRRGDVEVFASRDLELEGILRAWGRCLKRGLEVRCRRIDVEVWRCAAGVLPLFASRTPEL